ncbi:MAG: MFS family permease [Gammaproteobacteria bacterium]|jgi:MFS family permease
MDLSRYGWRAIMLIAMFSMLFQQAFSYVCQIVMPILADRIAEDFGISRGWLGFYLFIQNVIAIIAAIGCGGFILRYGPMRMSQWALVLMGSSLVVIASGQLWLYPLAAILLGAASVSTPASSHILAHVTPPRLAPLIFSIKQTGVPVGSLIGGFLVPTLLGLVLYSAVLGTPIRLGPYGTALGCGLIVFGVALLLQPLRAYFDRDRTPETKLSISDLPQTLALVLNNYPLRDIAFSAFAFGGLQSLFSGFFILYMIDGLDYSEAQAGQVFALSSISAIIARIAWGVLGGNIISARWVMAGIGFFGAVAAVLMARIDLTWTLFEITSVAVLYNITGLSWHGILLAETARLAPPDKVGGVTGGVLAFTSVAMMIYPAVYGALLAWTGSYKIGFVLGAVPSLIAFFVFIRRPVEGPWPRAAKTAAAAHLTARNALATAVILGLGAAIGGALYIIT